MKLAHQGLQGSGFLGNDTQVGWYGFTSILEELDASIFVA
jgi:hypothetical protein